MNSATECTCGNCPAIRMARGLAPFCKLSRESAPTVDNWSTLELAQAAYPGVVIVGRRGGMGHGPMVFAPKLNGLGRMVMK